MLKKLKKNLNNINWKKHIKRNIIIFAFLFAVVVFGPVIAFHIVKANYSDRIYYDIESVPKKRVAIVFGAAIWNNQAPSDVLRDRILTAANLYKQGKVEKIVMSGDNRFVNYNEPGVMIQYAIENGVKREDLQADYAGRRTYDTCIRAKQIFGIDEAILVTQEFHMPRTLYTCSQVGIDSWGVTSDLTGYVGAKQMQIRDYYATALAIIDINIRKPEVVMGEKISF